MCALPIPSSERQLRHVIALVGETPCGIRWYAVSVRTFIDWSDMEARGSSLYFGLYSLFPVAFEGTQCLTTAEMLSTISLSWFDDTLVQYQ